MVNAVRSTGVTVVGMGWYRSKDWKRLLQVISDRDEMYDSHAEWLAEAQRAERAVAAEGIQVKRVPVDPDELAAWCVIRGRTPNAAARAEFVTDKLQREAQQRR
ncbi:MAG TPA: hypothetical protein VFD73_00035 [Gemmatimonadales bacterium]|jgi:hypothetical protein|nr:hypothetical protein [Gemmatimonadales bacterium]